MRAALIRSAGAAQGSGDGDAGGDRRGAQADVADVRIHHEASVPHGSGGTGLEHGWPHIWRRSTGSLLQLRAVSTTRSSRRDDLTNLPHPKILSIPVGRVVMKVGSPDDSLSGLLARLETTHYPKSKLLYLWDRGFSRVVTPIVISISAGPMSHWLNRPHA